MLIRHFMSAYKSSIKDLNFFFCSACAEIYILEAEVCVPGTV